MRSHAFQGEEVVIEGWYRRSPVPHIELKKLTHNGKETRCYVHLMRLGFAVITIFTGLAIILTL